MRNQGAEGVDGVKTRREFSHTDTRSNQSLLWCGFCLKELEKTKWQWSSTDTCFFIENGKNTTVGKLGWGNVLTRKKTQEPSLRSPPCSAPRSLGVKSTPSCSTKRESTTLSPSNCCVFACVVCGTWIRRSRGWRELCVFLCVFCSFGDFVFLERFATAKAILPKNNYVLICFVFWWVRRGG